MTKLSKDYLKKEFGKKAEHYYKVDMFDEEGYERKICSNCGRAFWTCDSGRELCSDSTCVDYGFINNTITKGKWDYIETWELFKKFFESRGHTPIDRYPVVDRWRPDLYFTIASIQDFQRLDGKNMNFLYPANPLIVPQVCLRFPDIQNVGITGRHLTSFVMSGQHSFNHPNEPGAYFKNQCLRNNFDFLSGTMGIPKEELVYQEDVWAMPDFSAFGPCMETFSQGLELVNSVFMQFQTDGTDYGFRELDMKVIDVGWGHERLVWFSNGTPASYDSLFGPVCDNLKKIAGIKTDPELFAKYSKIAGSLDMTETRDLEKARAKVAERVGVSVKELKEEIEPLTAIYAIADHTRTLLFATADGGIPSNVGGGYNLRVILRRALGFIDEFDLDFDLTEIAGWHAKYLKPMFPELTEGLAPFQKIIGIEEGKYAQSKTKARSTIKSMIERGEKLDSESLLTLYESQGITPEEIKKFKPDLVVPSGFYEQITERHSSLKEDNSKTIPIDPNCSTEKLCYCSELEFEGTVINIIDDMVILDRTAFYATSGGQVHDLGTLKGIEVTEVIKQGNVILHKVKDASSFVMGEVVKGIVDCERRRQLSQNHTAVHIINGAARQVLGSHVWQAGSEVRPEKARLDITHHSAISKEELKQIEEIANKIVKEAIPIDKSILPRKDAEETYGFRVYQGGAIPQKELRITKIGDFDVEACGGTHCDNTSELVKIKILKVSKIQDGAVRLEFVAGNAAESACEEAKECYISSVESLAGLVSADLSTNFSEKEMETAAKALSVPIDQLPLTIERFVSEWNKYGAGMQSLGGQKAESSLDSAKSLSEACEILFSEWKKRQKEMKSLASERIKEEILAIPADEPKIRGMFFGMRLKDLEEDPTTPLEATMGKVMAVAKK